MSLKRTLARAMQRQQAKNQQIIIRRTMKAVQKLTKAKP